jgi:hypothetical protein
MSISSADIAKGREIVGRLLDALGIEAYLYELEPGDGVWELRVECAVPEGWKRCSWEVPAAELLASHGDPVLRERLLQHWSEQLGACKRR